MISADARLPTARILENHSGTDRTGRRRFSWPQVKEAFKDPQCYFSIANTFLSVSDSEIMGITNLIDHDCSPYGSV